MLAKKFICNCLVLI